MVDLYVAADLSVGGTSFAMYGYTQHLEAHMNQHCPHPSDQSLQPRLTRHAQLRMQQRGIRERDVEMVIRFGRRIHAKGLMYYVVGRKEMQHPSLKGRDLSRLSGLQVLVKPEDGVVVTTYRNADFHPIRSTPRDSRRSRRGYHH